MRSPDYVELRCASAFSFLDAASSPEDLAEQAAALGHSHMALTDRNGLYGTPRFHKAAAGVGLEALTGARVPVGRSGRSGKSGDELLLLAESPSGYRNLCRLLSLAHQRGEKGEAQSTWEELETHCGDLVCLVRGDRTLHPTLLDRTRALFGRDQLWVDVSRHLDRQLEADTLRAAAIAAACHVPVVASGDVRFARASERPLYDIFCCLRGKTTLDAAGRLLAPNAERSLQRPAEMTARFSGQPQWLRATRVIAERCSFRLHDLGYRFPDFPVPPGESPASWLHHLTYEGARARYGATLSTRVRRQLDHELGMIERLGLDGYFLIVWDIARYARARGMLAQGRGSAANSAVCYALSITAVDPIGMELLFERFLSEERGEWPDIDLDLPSGDQREDVIQYVFNRYGERGAAMTAVAITYRTRLAVREVGKVLGLESDLLDSLSKALSSLAHRDGSDDTEALLREAGVDPSAARIGSLLTLVEGMRGLPRHLGQHSGGIVIAAGCLDEVVPIEPAAMEGRRVVQWDKDDCADMGLIKIDLLGLGMLCALENTIELTRRHQGIEIDLAKLPPDDPVTYAMIQRADTMGTFQIESRAQMATLPRMKPERFYDLVVEVAIIRPGPIVGKMVHPYLDRRAGREPVVYPHPSLEPILKRTLGVPLFQEQLLRIAMSVAGFSAGEAEELRRAMGFKRSELRMRSIEEKLRRGMDERQITGEMQDMIVRSITSFALYGFPESHAASFALIAYASSYLKAHHPAAFLAGLLNAWPMGFYSPASLVKDTQHHGVEVRPIDVAHSNWLCDLENSRAPNQDPPEPAVRIGLRFAHGLRKESGLAIEAARRSAPFRDSADLAKRAALRREELLTLAELGALASIDSGASTRRRALWQVAALERDSDALLAGAPPLPNASPLPEMDTLDETLADYRNSGITAGPHILCHLREALRARGVCSAADLRDVPNGRFVRSAGRVIVRQRPGSAKGMCFLTLEDETGTSNAVLDPETFKRFRVPLHTSSIVEVAGPVQNVDGVIHVRVKALEGIALPNPAPDSKDLTASKGSKGGSKGRLLDLPSHDYH